GKRSPSTQECAQRSAQSEELHRSAAGELVTEESCAHNQIQSRQSSCNGTQLNEQVRGRPEGVPAYGDVPGDVPDTANHGRDSGDQRRPDRPGHTLRTSFYCALREYGGGGAHGSFRDVYLSLAVVEG